MGKSALGAGELLRQDTCGDRHSSRGQPGRWAGHAVPQSPGKQPQPSPGAGVSGALVSPPRQHCRAPCGADGRTRIWSAAGTSLSGPCSAARPWLQDTLGLGHFPRLEVVVRSPVPSCPNVPNQPSFPYPLVVPGTIFWVYVRTSPRAVGRKESILFCPERKSSAISYGVHIRSRYNIITRCTIKCWS